MELLGAALYSTIGAVLALMFWCDLVARSLDWWQQRRFDRWHRERLVRRWSTRAATLRCGKVAQRADDRVHDVSKSARRMRRPSLYGPALLPFSYLRAPAHVLRWLGDRSSRKAAAAARHARYRTHGEGTTKAGLLVIASVLLFVVAMMIFATTPIPEDYDTSTSTTDGTEFAPFALGMMPLWLSVLAYRGALRATALPASEMWEAYGRRPVLYLRSFGDDRLRMRAHRSSRHGVVERFALGRRDRVEEIIVERLWKYGPVIAVGQPGETGTTLGAAREQLSFFDWRETVERRMTEAALIVVMLGRSSGLAWEIESLSRLRLWHKVIWIFPPVDVAEIERRWSEALRLLRNHGAPHANLGADPGEVLVARSRSNGGIVSFTSHRRDDWSYEVALEAAAGG